MRMLDLFSGIGGFSLAAEWAGIETVAFCEIDPYCRQILSRHWPEIPIYGDIRELTKKRLEQDGVLDNGAIDIICGGFPCQPFSIAGKRKGKADDRYLWPEMFRLIRELRPTWVVGENVAGIVGLALDDILSDLESEGYTVRAFLIPACSVGAPHKRERVFIVAHAFHSGVQRRAEIRDVEGQRAEQNQHPERRGELYSRETGTAQSGVGGDFDGFSGWMDGTRWPAAFGEEQHDWEPPRVASGVKNRVPRLKALGNAVVPQQVYPILRAIRTIG